MLDDRNGGLLRVTANADWRLGIAQPKDRRGKEKERKKDATERTGDQGVVVHKGQPSPVLRRVSWREEKKAKGPFWEYK